jgi:hypothetical protein
MQDLTFVVAVTEETQRHVVHQGLDGQIVVTKFLYSFALELLASLGGHAVDDADDDNCVYY